MSGGGKAGVIWRGLSRRLGLRRSFGGTADWALSLYDALLRFRKSLPLPGRAQLRRVRVRGTRHPLYIRLGTSDGFTLEEIFLQRVYRSVTDAELGEVRQVVDLGANVGMTVRLWADRYPAARIVAVEPDEANLAVCRANTAADASRITLVRACVAGRPGVVHLDRSGDACAYRMADGAAMGEPVPAMTLPQILDHAGFKGEIDLLKCDIEGAEREVFGDCGDWVGRVRNVIVELHPPYTREMLLADLARQGAGLAVRVAQMFYGNDVLLLSRQDIRGPSALAGGAAGTRRGS
jgi:FkbM family methyltransferase